MKKLNYQSVIPNMRFGLEGVCSYCGLDADQIDHVIPWSYIALPGERRTNARGITTYSCQWCNVRLGAILFPSMLTRLMHIEGEARSLSKKYRRAPQWGDEEIMELDGSLRSYVIKAQAEMRVIDSIASWAFSPKYFRIIDTVRSSDYVDDESPRRNPFVIEFFRDLIEG